MEARRREHERHEEREREPERERERERREARLEPVERPSYEFENRLALLPDLVHWSAVWAGLVGAFGVMIVLGLLGLAVGLGAAPGVTPGQVGTASAVWGVIITIVAFFVGGWLAGRTSSYRGYRGNNFIGFILGSMVWALGIIFAILLTAIGVGGAMGAAFGAFGVPTGPPTPGAVETAQNAAIGAFIAVVLAYIACVIGAIVGIGSVTREHEAR